MNTQVSVIMPCHSGERYLKESIDSVLAQTYTNWELLIVDDCSNDRSYQIALDYAVKDSRIKVFKNPKSTGLPATPRNLAISKASGRFIAFLDCDDIWLPTKLERQLPLFNDKQCAIVFSYYEKINEESEICSKTIKTPKSVSYRDLLFGDCIGNLTGVYDTEKLGKIFQKEIHAEDYLMYLEILKRGFRAVNTNSVEGRYRISSNSTSSNKLKSACWNWNIYKNELHLPIPVATFYFCVYCFKGLIKFLK